MNEIIGILLGLLVVNYIVFFVIFGVMTADYITSKDEAYPIKSVQIIKSKRQVVLSLIPYYFIIDLSIRGIVVCLKKFKEFYISLD